MVDLLKPHRSASLSEFRQMLLLRMGGSLAFRLVATGLSFVISILLARSLGTEAYGSYVFVVSVVGLTTTFVTFGVPSLLTREIAKSRGSGNWEAVAGLEPRAWQLALIASAATVALYFLHSYLIVNRGDIIHVLLDPYLIALTTIPFTIIISLNSSLLNGFEFVLASQLIDAIVRPISTTILIALSLLLFGSLSLQTALFLLLTATVFAALLSAFLRARLVDRKWATTVRSTPQVTRPFQWLLTSALIMANQLLILSTTQIDILMLGWLSTTHEVAFYFAASRGAFLVTFIFGSLTAAIGPTVARLWAAGSSSDLQSFVSRSALLAFIPISLLSAILFIYGGYFLDLFGTEYRSAWTSLGLLLIGWSVCVAAGPAQVTLIMCNRHGLSALLFALSAILNILLNFALIPRLGTAGASTATALSLVFLGAAWSLASKFSIGIRTDVFAAMHLLLRTSSLSARRADI